MKLHEDPFDRMLVAQAEVKDLAVVSADPGFAGYGVSVLEA
jgi:PIN domain nuclease of toxin-antitoxin system